jgi:hypothetical protein
VSLTQKLYRAHLADPDVQSLDISGFVNDKEQVRKAVEITRSVYSVRLRDLKQLYT